MGATIAGMARFNNTDYNCRLACESGGIGRRAGFRCQWGNP